jgi:hypothetical protein
MNVKTKRNYRVLVDQMAKDKIDAIINLCNEEVGFLGCVERDDEVFYITDVYLFEQEVSSTTCELDPVSQAKLVQEIMCKNDSDTAIKLVNSMRFWGHSHVRMGVTPSNQDDRQIEELVQDCDDFFIMGIFNKRGETYFEIHLVSEQIIISEVPMLVYSPERVLIEDQIKKELEDKLTVKKYQYNHFMSNKKYDYYQKSYKDNGHKKKETIVIENENTYKGQLDTINDDTPESDLVSTEEYCGYGITKEERDELTCDYCKGYTPDTYNACDMKLSFDGVDPNIDAFIEENEI